MLISNKNETATLRVYTADAAAEISIIDGNHDVVRRDVGTSLEVELPLGIYKVKVRSAAQFEEQFAVLDRAGAKDEKDFKRLEFASPIPLYDTAQTHEFHQYNAADHSRNFHYRIGSGSAIYVFARDWTAKHKTGGEKSKYDNPARGLTLYDETGETELVEFQRGSSNLDWEPWTACNVEVNPGNYRLRLTLADKTQIEQTIVAAPCWQTQIFLLQRNYAAKGEDYRADLAGGAVVMNKLKKGFDPGSNGFRLEELARLALARGRQILSTEVQDLLWKKYKNPMSGIYGAHLLLADQNPDLKLLKTVVKNLRKLLEIKHPDVEALALKLEDDESDYVFNVPPMLRRSWAIVVAASAERPELVPENSFADSISERLWGPEPLLLWTNTKNTAKAYENALIEQLKIWKQGFPETAADDSPKIESQQTRDLNDMISADETYFSDTELGSKNLEDFTADNLRETTPTYEFTSSEKSSENLMSELVRNLGLPRSKVAQILARVERRD